MTAEDSYLGISTHTPLAGRDPYVKKATEWLQISTHTPLAGRDVGDVMPTGCIFDFYTPLAGRDSANGA